MNYQIDDFIYKLSLPVGLIRWHGCCW